MMMPATTSTRSPTLRRTRQRPPSTRRETDTIATRDHDPGRESRPLGHSEVVEWVRTSLFLVIFLCRHQLFQAGDRLRLFFCRRLIDHPRRTGLLHDFPASRPAVI